MKKFAGSLALIFFVLFLCTSNLWAEETMAPAEPEKVMQQAAPDVLDEAQALLNKSGLENCKLALDLCTKAVKANPESFKANWLCAQACREYGNEVKKAELNDWEDVCKVQGKAGMAYAEKAIALDSAKVDGHYWYGMNVGIYSDGVSILTALKEGLKDKTQNSFETAYKINKKYDKGGPIGALARFWQVLPWPLNDNDLSTEYFREFQKTEFYNDPETVEVRVYFAELLMDSRKTKKEAEQLLNEAIKMTKDKYWQKKAQALLDDM